MRLGERSAVIEGEREAAELEVSGPVALAEGVTEAQPLADVEARVVRLAVEETLGEGVPLCVAVAPFAGGEGVELPESPSSTEGERGGVCVSRALWEAAAILGVAALDAVGRASVALASLELEAPVEPVAATNGDPVPG